MFCSNCGKENRDDAAFCKYCGTSLRQPEIINGNNSDSNETVNMGRKKKKSKAWIIIPVILVLLVVICLTLVGGGLLFLSTPWAKEKKQLFEAKRYISSGDYNNAIAAYENLIQMDDKNEDYYNSLIGLYEDRAEEFSNEGDDERAQKIYDKLLKLYSKAYEGTNNEYYLTQKENLEKQLIVPDTLCGWAVYDDDYSYIFTMDLGRSADDLTGKILKHKKTEDISEAEVIAENITVFHEGLPLYLDGDRIYYSTLTENGDLNFCWVDKNGRKSERVPTDDIYNQYVSLTNAGNNKSLYSYFYSKEYGYDSDNTNFFLGFLSIEKEGFFGFRPPYIDNNKMLYDSTFIVDLNDYSVEAIPFPDAEDNLYLAIGLNHNKVYYFKFNKGGNPQSFSELKFTDNTVLYSFDLKNKSEEQVAVLNYGLRDFIEGSFDERLITWFINDNLYIVDTYDAGVLSINLNNGKVDEISPDPALDCYIEDTTFAYNDSGFYFTNGNGLQIKYDYQNQSFGQIPGSESYDPNLGIWLWGVSDENVYYTDDDIFTELFFCDSLNKESVKPDSDLLNETNEEVKQKKKVGIAMPTKDLQRWNQDGINLESQLKAAGYEVDLQFASNDINTQIVQIDNMISSGCDVLVIAAIDGDSLGTVLDLAKQKNIPVIAYDRLIMNSDAVTYYTTFDNYMVGKKQGQYIEEKLGLKEGNWGYNIEIFAGDPGDNNARFFYGGAMDVLNVYFDSGQISVPSGQIDFDTVATSNWATDIAQSRMESILFANYSDGTQLDAVLCSNDSTAFGVENALENYYIGAYPIITGQDCDVANVKNMLAGRQSMSVFKETKTLVGQTVKMVDAILTGEDVPINDRETYNNGVKVVPSYLCEPIVVDIYNYYDVLINSGYYDASVFD